MDAIVATALQRYRNAYNYPGATIRIAGGALPDTPFAQHGLPFQYDDCETFPQTVLRLDQAFAFMLRSPNPLTRQRGVAAVIFWGFYTFSPLYARKRVSWLIQPERGNGWSLIDVRAMACLSQAADLVDAGQFGQALAAAGHISQLSRTPFASKLVTFLSPETAGVYDNRIGDALADTARIPNSVVATWLLSELQTRDIGRGVGAVNLPRIQRRYAAWCEFLSLNAAAINDLGLELQWTDPEAGRCAWRAVDVERAIFAATSPIRESPSSP